MDQEGNLGRESQGRAMIASKLFQKCAVDYMITLGCDYRIDSPKKISDVMKYFIIANYHIKPNSIISEPRSRDTVGDAVYTAIAIKELGLKIKTIYVVTSDYHQERALAIFKFIFGNEINILSPLAFKTNSLNKLITRKSFHEKKSMEAFTKTFDKAQKGNLDQIFSNLIQKHPYYNGEIHLRIE